MTSCCCLASVNPYQEGLILRFGNLIRTVSSGLVVLNPCMDSIILIDKRDSVVNLRKQEVLTSDNVSVQIDATIHYQINNPMKAFVAVADLESSLLNLVALEVRSLIATRPMKTLNAYRDGFATALIEKMAPVAEKWGIGISMIQLNDIELDANLRKAMAALAETEVLVESKLANARNDVQIASVLTEAKIITAKNDVETARIIAEARVIDARAEIEAAGEYARAALLHTDKSLQLRQFSLWKTISTQPSAKMVMVPTNMLEKVSIAT